MCIPKVQEYALNIKTHMINILMSCIQHELIVEYRQV